MLMLGVWGPLCVLALRAGAKVIKVLCASHERSVALGHSLWLCEL